MESREKSPTRFIPPTLTEEASSPKVTVPSIGTHMSEGDGEETTVMASSKINPQTDVEQDTPRKPTSPPVATHFSQIEGEEMESHLKELSGGNPVTVTEVSSQSVMKMFHH